VKCASPRQVQRARPNARFKHNFPTVTHPTAGMPQKTAGFYGRSRFVVLKITALSEDISH
jgi:hypothetical protein